MSPDPSGEREVEDDERREDEEEHRGQGVAAAELDPQVLARQRDDVGEVGHASASFLCGQRREPRRLMRRDDDGSHAGQRLELAIEQRGSSLIQSGVRLVEDEQLGVVEQSPAEREPLRHPREYVDTRSLRASHREKRSRSMPIRSRLSGTR